MGDGDRLLIMVQGIVMRNESWRTETQAGRDLVSGLDPLSRRDAVS